MTRRLPWSLSLLATCVTAASSHAVEAKLATEFVSDIRPILATCCADCHKAGKDVPFLAAQTLDDIQSRRGRWRSVVAQLRNHIMPLFEQEQPSAARARSVPAAA